MMHFQWNTHLVIDSFGFFLGAEGASSSNFELNLSGFPPLPKSTNDGKLKQVFTVKTKHWLNNINFLRIAKNTSIKRAF